jgi:enoyl-CoA hydratase/carnithine racemase
MKELEEIVMNVADDPEVRVVIITGSGEKAFCVGSDIKEFPELCDNFVEKKLQRENTVFSHIEAMPKPVIAALNGFTLGGGCELALACDIRIMDERARIGQPEINLGTFPGSGGPFRLTRAIGAARAMQLMWQGDMLTAKEALDFGIVQEIAPAGKLDKVVYKFAFGLSKRAAFAVSCIKKMVQAAPFQTMPEAIQLSLELSEAIFKTMDSVEGVNAFLEKRSPHFAGAPSEELQDILDNASEEKRE